MRETTLLQAESINWAASLALHLAVAITLALLPLPVEESVSVEVLTLRQFEAAMSSDVAGKAKEPATGSQFPQLLGRQEPATSSRLPEVEAAPAAVAQPQTMVRATEFLSAGALADPRSRKAREELKSLALGDRIIQLCNIEAMEQVHRWKAELRPDTLMAYAMAGVRLSERSVEAHGGAFRSEQHWYGIRFKCEVTADRERVSAFEFAVGDEIPRTEWAVHDLPAGDAQD
jgi:hypothetical protein